MPSNTAFCQRKITETPRCPGTHLLVLLMDCAECFAILQEEKESQAKADKIKLALEKLKEAKVKKVNCESAVCGAVQISDILLC